MSHPECEIVLFTILNISISETVEAERPEKRRRIDNSGGNFVNCTITYNIEVNKGGTVTINNNKQS